MPSSADTRESVVDVLPTETEPMLVEGRAACHKEEDPEPAVLPLRQDAEPAVGETPGPHVPAVEEEIPSFTCVIERDRGPWGLQVHPMHPYLQVSHVKADGPFAQYNSENPRKIVQDDMIISVNGCEVPKRMIAIIKDEECNKLELLCSRPKRLDLEIRREPGQSLGIIVEHQADLNGLLVKQIEENSVASFGHSYAEVGEKLLPTDLILAINDQVGDPGKMKSAMKESNVIKLIALRVSRPHVPS